MLHSKLMMPPRKNKKMNSGSYFHWVEDSKDAAEQRQEEIFQKFYGLRQSLSKASLSFFHVTKCSAAT